MRAERQIYSGVVFLHDLYCRVRYMICNAFFVHSNWVAYFIYYNCFIILYITARGIYSYQKLIFFPNQVKVKVDFFPPFFLERWAGSWAELSRRRQCAAGENFLEDRLGYPAISMNFKTESFTYVIHAFIIIYWFYHEFQSNQIHLLK